MVFSSMTFLWLFLPIVLAIYFIGCKIGNIKIKNIILLISSLFFYAWGEPKYILLMLISIVINYIFGLLINQYKNARKTILFLAIVTNIGLLIYFKYFNFFVGSVNSIFGTEVIGLKEIALPIGISFYTFQTLSYLIDLYKGEIKVQKNILNLALYISFFPQLIAGPIIKYKDIEQEILYRQESIGLFATGIRRFVYGLGKKVLLANNLALIADNIYVNELESLNTPVLWFAAIAYTLQIYFDFSGYSDMAIGLGKMFGFNFPENFNLPYISQSITEFWRRWHISLSTWFKQYLYIPLGGNRKGTIRTYINLSIVFLTTGLWHGASYNFLIWGIYNGIFIVLERIFLKKLLDKNRIKVFNHIYFILVVIIGWVFFRSESIVNGLQIIMKMFSFNFNSVYVLLPIVINKKMIVVLLASFILCGPAQVVFEKLKKKNKIKEMYNNMEFLVIASIMFFTILDLVASTYNPFIYFRF